IEIPEKATNTNNAIRIATKRLPFIFCITSSLLRLNIVQSDSHSKTNQLQSQGPFFALPELHINQSNSMAYSTSIEKTGGDEAFWTEEYNKFCPVGRSGNHY